MPESSQRRIEAEASHNLFWITDLEGKYGLRLQSNELFQNFDIPAKLKGISLLKRNSSNYGELFLVLNKKEDWQIFHTLCDDLIATTHKYQNDVAMISAVEIRLKRWQQLLKQDRNKEMSLERQMGLFSELSCLKDIIAPKIGIKQAIDSWVGADFDKQDFLLDMAIIEVKSYKTSKGAKINISSLEQLYSDNKPLYLVSYSLTTSENGLSLNDMVESIKDLLKSETNEIYEIFDNKLIEYGFIPEIMETKQLTFIIDKIWAFYVSDDFPKIIPHNIKSQITNVKYSIDLHYCTDYEIAIEDMFKEDII